MRVDFGFHRVQDANAVAFGRGVALQNLFASAELAVWTIGCFSLVELNRIGAVNLMAKRARPDQLLAKSTEHDVAIGNMVGHVNLGFHVWSFGFPSKAVMMSGFAVSCTMMHSRSNARVVAT